MSCDDVLMSLMARRDGEDAPLPTEEVEAHLGACPSCRAEAAAEAALDARLKSARPAALPPRARSAAILVAAAALVLLLRTGVLLQVPAGAWTGSLGAVALIALAFLAVKENPLRIHPRPD